VRGEPIILKGGAVVKLRILLGNWGDGNRKRRGAKLRGQPREAVLTRVLGGGQLAPSHDDVGNDKIKGGPTVIPQDVVPIKSGRS
jgi:hypothetical protein